MDGVRAVWAFFGGMAHLLADERRNEEITALAEFGYYYICMKKSGAKL